MKAGVVKVVAIDGPAGSGKSTVARGLAAALDLPTLDTGAMYRATALAALEAGIDLDDADAVAAVARTADIDVERGVTTLDGTDVSDEIRGPRVTGAVSQVSSHPPVRAVLVERQRAWVERHGGGVVEGRDIGTVVLPDAPLKVFITARDEVRAARRQRDEAAAQRAVEAAAVRDALNQRDRADGTLGRATRPEDAASDAVIVDTSDVTADEVITDLVARARAIFSGVGGSGVGGSGVGGSGVGGR
ncbi:MAG TPA: (d)CMP kinase [Acidimicrobiia bacterium]